MVTSCEEDKLPVPQKYFGVTPNIHFSTHDHPIVEYVNSDEVHEFVASLEKRTGKKSSKNSGTSSLDTDFGTVALDNALLAIDTLGRKNVSFALYPDEPNPRVIFNLVVGHADKGDEPPIYVMALEKSDAYYEGEISGALDMDSFSGKMYRYPLNDSESAKNPFSKSGCDPIDIASDPSEGGTGDTTDDGSNSGGGGFGEGLGGGDSPNGGPDAGNGVPYPCIITTVCPPCSVGGLNCHAPAPQPGGGVCSGNLGSTNYYFSGDCGVGEDYMKISVSGRSGDCSGSDGAIGINLYEVAEVIEEKIQSINLDPCSSQILTQLKKLNQNDIAQVLLRFGAVQSVYDWELENESLTSGNVAETDRRNNIEVFDYVTNIDSNYVNQATEISIARTILHEMLHAYMISNIDDVNAGNTVDVKQFLLLWQYIRNTTSPNGSTQSAQHEYMANRFISPLKAALKEWDNSSQSEQYYEDLAWGALFDTDTFSHFHPVGSGSRSRIINTNAAEDTNTNQNGISPKGNPCF